jgi:hypothetical protein
MPEKRMVDCWRCNGDGELCAECHENFDECYCDLNEEADQNDDVPFTKKEDPTNG